MSRKKSSYARENETFFGMTFAPGSPTYPTAYADNIWDIINKKDVTGGVVLSEMLKLLGGSWQEVEEPTGNPSELGYYEQSDDVYVLSSDTSVDEEKTYYTLPTDIIGQYTASELNEKFAEAINNINASVGAINEQGNYRSNNGQPFASEAALLAYNGIKNHNDYAIVKDTSTSDSIKYAFYKYDATYSNGSGRWYKEYEWLGISLTTAQKNAINSGITDSKVQKLNGLPTSDELTEALSAKQDNLTFDSTPTEDSNNPVTSGGVYAATSANAAAASANAAEITGIKGKMSSQASTTNKLITEDEVNDKIEAQAANFHGTLETEENLPTDAKLNDYAFVIFAPNYTAVSSPKGNPSLKNYFERSGAGTTQSPYVYSPTTDTTVDANKTYYIGEGNPEYRRYKVAKTTDTSKVLDLVGIEVNGVIYYRDAEHDSESGSSTLAPYCWSDLSGDNKVYTKELSMVPRTGSSGTDYDTVYNGSSTSAEAAGYVDKMVGWTFEYTLNNSSFTAPQWNAINSGITPTQQQYLADLIETKANDLFTVSVVATDTSMQADDDSTHTLTLTATVKFNGSVVDCTNASGVATAPTDWTRTGKGTYTRTKTYTRSSTGDGLKLSVHNNEFTYLVPTTDSTFGGTFVKRTIVGPKKNNPVTDSWYEASIIYPIFYGWSKKSLNSSSADYVGDGISAAIAALNTRVTNKPSKITTGSLSIVSPNKFSTTSVGTEYFWVVAKNRADITAMTVSQVDATANNVTFSSKGGNGVANVNLTGYIAVCTKAFDSKPCDFGLTAS